MLRSSQTPTTATTPSRRRFIHCSKRSDSYANGSSRSDWKSSCAILSGKVVSQEQSESVLSAVNGVAESSGLNLVPFDNNSLVPNQQAKKKPLTITDLSPAPIHGSSLRVAYQGVPGAYSEAAAGKAYPNCQPIPCDQFEVAFQAVELWIADRAVLPVENSLGGSIHRNYDLLLRHRLHIVGEVQLPVHHCLMALPGHFEYMFYVDFEASMAEARAQNALSEVQEFTSFLRVLGSYPMDMTSWSPSSSSSTSSSSSSTFSL
ncbi:unnamed protein product [Thlaspi arvense]|uniref:Prephenate dehydratase domain-containing protein n=1 Tax=Thlaspi arvense TaxID=13288 RepID=A0AAU9SAJ3_THLAR|nr:unnamed protein product [Thlaspi arvense]